MTLPAPFDMARRFRDLVLTAEPPPLSELSKGLDALVLAVQEADDLVPTTEGADPPPHDYAALYAAIRARFPDLGFYSVSDPLVLPAEPMTGDAIDDLADIVIDLADALWRYDHNGLADALWDLTFSYRTHWGAHARDLAAYLHARQYG